MPTGRLSFLFAAALLCAAAGSDHARAGRPALPPAFAAGGLERVADQKRPAPPIDAAQRAAIEKFIDKHGRKVIIDPDASQGLKLSKGGAPVTVDQVSLVDKKDPYGRHILDRLADGSGFLVQRQTRTARALFELGRNLELVDAYVVKIGKPGHEDLAPAAATQAVSNELRLWAAVAAQQK
jgi:hypothetical protein